MNIVPIKPIEYAEVEMSDTINCPFCNGVGSVDQDCDGMWYVACINKNCLVLPITISFRSRRHAIRAWNHRSKGI